MCYSMRAPLFFTADVFTSTVTVVSVSSIEGVKVKVTLNGVG